MVEESKGLRLGKSLARGGLVLAVFLLLEFTGRPLFLLFIPEKGSYVRWALISLYGVAGSLIAVMAIYRDGIRKALKHICLDGSLLRALGFGFAVTAPMAVAFALTSPLPASVDLLHLVFSSFVAAIAEEVLFRGFAFWMLYRYAGWNFWLAALVPAMLFGYGHMYQGKDVLSATLIFAITAVGSVWFSWLLLRWQNLWVPILVHALMNLWWDIFNVDESALGGGLANAVRIAVIVVSVIVTLYATRKTEPELGEAERI